VSHGSTGGNRTGHHETVELHIAMRLCVHRVAVCTLGPRPAIPGRPIRIISPFAAGSSTDVIARIIAQQTPKAPGNRSSLIRARERTAFWVPTRYHSVADLIAAAKADPGKFTIAHAASDCRW
jgi:tripartite-type tricarboxylate transporter receptor subunit TctC